MEKPDDTWDEEINLGQHLFRSLCHYKYGSMTLEELARFHPEVLAHSATKKVAGFMRRIEQKASAMPIARHRHELDTGSGDAEGPPPGVRRASAWRSLTR